MYASALLIYLSRCMRLSAERERSACTIRHIKIETHTECTYTHTYTYTHIHIRTYMPSTPSISTKDIRPIYVGDQRTSERAGESLSLFSPCMDEVKARGQRPVKSEERLPLNEEGKGEPCFI